MTTEPSTVECAHCKHRKQVDDIEFDYGYGVGLCRACWGQMPHRSDGVPAGFVRAFEETIVPTQPNEWPEIPNEGEVE